MRLAICAALALLALFAPIAAKAAPCAGDAWQPTFVVDADHGDGPYYVQAGNGFIKLYPNGSTSLSDQACQLINSQGVREPHGLVSCEMYDQLMCECNRSDLGNSTCARFFLFLKAQALVPTPAPSPAQGQKAPAVPPPPPQMPYSPPSPAYQPPPQPYQQLYQ
jgi:hypothetical protein